MRSQECLRPGGGSGGTKIWRAGHSVYRPGAPPKKGPQRQDFKIKSYQAQRHCFLPPTMAAAAVTSDFGDAGRVSVAAPLHDLKACFLLPCPSGQLPPLHVVPRYDRHPAVPHPPSLLPFTIGFSGRRGRRPGGGASPPPTAAPTARGRAAARAATWPAGCVRAAAPEWAGGEGPEGRGRVWRACGVPVCRHPVCVVPPCSVSACLSGRPPLSPPHRRAPPRTTPPRARGGARPRRGRTTAAVRVRAAHGGMRATPCTGSDDARNTGAATQGRGRVGGACAGLSQSAAGPAGAPPLHCCQWGAQRPRRPLLLYALLPVHSPIGIRPFLPLEVHGRVNPRVHRPAWAIVAP